MWELLLVGCSSVVVLLHGASLFLRALLAPRHAVARHITSSGSSPDRRRDAMDCGRGATERKGRLARPDTGTAGNVVVFRLRSPDRGRAA
ncbi:hypothetical protein ACP4OV_024780 [Aristida adscensionis]